MLTRYRIVRGKRPAEDALPHGVRQDTRKHTRHVLRPEDAAVREFLTDPTEAAFERFRDSYLETLKKRFSQERAAFETLADLARNQDVFIGCNCPTQLQPRVERCHTTLALGFMRLHYPDLNILD